MTKGNRQRLYLFLIMVLIATGVGAISIYILYHTAVEDHRKDLIYLAKSQARLIEAVARFDSQYSSKYPGGTREATLSQIREAHKTFKGFGKTGEFILAELKEDQIIFLLRHRQNQTLSTPQLQLSVSESSKYAQYFKKALDGESGITVGQDYRGITVLAAYEPVDILKFGLVAKIDISEIKAPFIKAGISAGTGGLIIILVGTYVFFRISDPFIKELENHNKEQSAEIHLRKLLEKKLLLSEERLDLAIKASREGLWDWPDLEADKMWWSPQSYKILEYNIGETFPSISNFLNHVHRNDLIMVQRAMTGHLKEKEPFDIEFRLKTKLDNYKWMRAQGEAILDYNEKAVRMTGSIQDINDRKIAEDKVRKLSRAVEQSHSSIIITDKAGNIEYVNPSFTETNGYSKEEVIGQNTRLLKSGETPQEEYEKLWKTISSGKSWHGIFHNKKKDGTLYWESAVISPIKDASGKITHYLGIKENITQQKLIEEKLLESEQRFRTLVDQAVDAIYVHDNDGNFVHANQKTCTSLGYTYDELLHLSIENIEVSYNLKNLKIVWSTIEPGETLIIESVHKRKDGSTFPVEINLGQIRLDGSIRYLAFARDITSRKEVEAQLRVAEAQMITSEKLAGIGQLAAGVSHEVLNPVNIISVHTQMLQRKKKEDQELQVFCTKVRHEIDRIQKIMGTLLNFSRKSNSAFEKIQPVEIINDVISLVEQDFSLDNITISKNYSNETESSFTLGDKDKLRQVFLNLINNSKYSMKDGGVLTLNSNSIEKNDREYIRLTFSDTGKGINKEILNRIFEPFFSTKPEGQGTGLGLSVAHRIIEDHKGFIDVESTEGKGTSFFIDLPLA
jgi:nitrogen fixation negative regulator NifL